MYTFEYIKTFLAQSPVKFLGKRGITSYRKCTIIMQCVIVVIPDHIHLLLSLLFSLCLRGFVFGSSLAMQYYLRVFCNCCNYLNEEEREGKLFYLCVFIYI